MVWHEASLLGTAAASDDRKSTCEQDLGEELARDASVIAADEPVTLSFPEEKDDPSVSVTGKPLSLPDVV